VSARLSGKVALVTGGSRGIGRGIVSRLAAEGAEVHFFYRNDELAAHDLARVVEAAGGRAVPYRVDVTNHDALRTAVDQVRQQAGRIDLLVNNAGINKDGLALMMSVEEFRSVIETNLVSAFLISQLVGRLMVRQRGGAIVNVSSIAARRPQPGHCNYAASKAALEAFSVSLAKELAARDVRVNCVAPGVVETDMMKSLIETRGADYLKRIPQARYGTPEDVAEVCVFLLSDEARYVTGQTFAVDGGMSA
jgi:3-oxoacyl-[acyl-carrier protein] reductase